MQKPNFEAMIATIGKELDCNQELLNTLIIASGSHKDFISSGHDFVTQVQESGWISPDNPDPLYNALERVNRHDIVHKAELEALVHGMSPNDVYSDALHNIIILN